MPSPETTGADMTTLLAYEAGQREAETRIVAWLRDQYPATQDMTSTYICEAIDLLAAALERGEHRKQP